MRFEYGEKDATEPRQLFPTLPYNLRAGSHARMGAVFQNGAEATTLTEFLIEVPPGFDLRRHDGLGAPLFNNWTGSLLNPYPAEANAGAKCGDKGATSHWEIVSERLVRWCGVRAVAEFGTLSFLVDVPIQVVPDSREPRTRQVLTGTDFDLEQSDYWHARLDFSGNDYEAFPVDGPGAWRTAPGVARFKVQPATAWAPGVGYPTVAAGNGALGDGNFFKATLDTGKTVLEGPSGNGASYELFVTVPGLSSLEGAVMNSTLEPASRAARAGSSVAVGVDFEAVVRELGKLGSAVTNVVHRLDVFVPASLPGKPFLWFIEELDDTLPAPVMALASGQVISGGDDEILLASGDGRVYALSTATGAGPTQTPPLWNARASDGTFDDAAFVLAGDVDPTTAGTVEVLTASSQGVVTLVDGATGVERWMFDTGGAAAALAFDANVTSGAPVNAPEGRVFLVGTSSTGRMVLHLVTPGGVGGFDAEDSVELPVGGLSHAALAPFQASAAAEDRAVAIALDGRDVFAYDADGGDLWSSSDSSSSARVLAAAAHDFSLLGGPGEEIVVAWSDGVSVFDAAGAELARWEPPAGVRGTIGNVSASVVGSGAPEVVFVGSDDAIYLLDLDRSPAPPASDALVWKSPGISIGVGSEPRPIGGAVGGSNVLDRDHCYSEAGSRPGDLLYNVCLSEVTEEVTGSVTEIVRPRTVRAMSDASGAGARPLVVFGGVTERKAYVVGLFADDGSVAWTPWEMPDIVRRSPSAIVEVPRAPTALGDPQPPFFAIGLDAGALLLFEWASGDSAWASEVSPGAAAGEFTYYVTLPTNALPGTYVVTATLTWDQDAGASGTVEQSARALNWFDVAYEDGSPIEDPFTIPVTLRTWLGPWD